MDNEYLIDGCAFLNRGISRICDKLSDEELPEVVLCIALGIERLLKSVLYTLNPIYVFKVQEFKNTVAILHTDRLTSAADSSKEIAAKPNRDVLSFRAALARAKTVSEVISDHTALLYSLSEQRDIVAHCMLSMLKLERCRQILERDLCTFLRAFAAETGVTEQRLFGTNKVKFQKFSADHQDDVETKLSLKLDIHKNNYKQLFNQPGYEASMCKKTHDYVSRVSKSSYRFRQLFICPACGNKAVVSLETDYDIIDGEGVITGMFVTELRCFYCKLHIEEYDEIDYLHLNEDVLAEEYPDHEEL